MAIKAPTMDCPSCGTEDVEGTYLDAPGPGSISGYTTDAGFKCPTCGEEWIEEDFANGGTG